MKYATMIGWTDRQAHEVTREVSAKCKLVRRMNAKLLNGVMSGEPDALEFSPGGFCGHTSGVQRYEYSSNTDNREFRIRLHKDGVWRDSGGNKFKLMEAPYELYDFNF